MYTENYIKIAKKKMSNVPFRSDARKDRTD